MSQINKARQHFTLPRIYLGQNLKPGSVVDLAINHVHYFRTVLRRQAGDPIRIFNADNGEFLARLSTLSKKAGQAEIIECLRQPPEKTRKIHLIFSPIKKHRMDILIEKSVELGVTDFHPAFMDRTQIRRLKHARIQSQIHEAAEQCERLDIPVLHDPLDLSQVIANWQTPVPLYWCYEHADTPIPPDTKNNADTALIIGPEGGFTDKEATWLSTHKNIETISLGDTVYRVETAALVFLARIA